MTAPYLRWTLLRGETSDGIRWVLREEGDGSPPHPLVLEAHPSVADLVDAVTPIVGRPIADTLAELTREALPEALAAS